MIKISFLDIFYSIAPLPMKLFKALDYLAGGMAAFLSPSLPGKSPPKKIQKILIIRPGGIGDAVFLLPILKVLKDQGLIIDILCEKRNVEVFNSQSRLFNKVYLYDQQPLAVFANYYDVVVDTEQWHYLSALTACFVPSSYKIGFATRPRRAKLFHKAVKYGVDEYELDNFLRLFEDIIMPGAIKALESCFEVDLSAQDWAKGQIKDDFVTVFLGASIIPRRLNEGQIKAIVSYFLAENYSVVFLGGSDVQDVAQKMTAKIDSPKIFNNAGKLSLMQSAALIQRSALFIGPDSGLLHLACALDVPVLGIFSTGNLTKWGPKGEKHKVITDNVPCSPCTRFGYTIPTCHGSYHCIRNLNLTNRIKDKIHGL